MSMRHEQYQALLRTREFLQDLLTAEISSYLNNNLPNGNGFNTFDSDTERYAWLDAQIEKLKQEEK
jgi:hypothetical protein